jgi:hypothetical protein
MQNSKIEHYLLQIIQCCPRRTQARTISMHAQSPCCRLRPPARTISHPPTPATCAHHLAPAGFGGKRTPSPTRRLRRPTHGISHPPAPAIGAHHLPPAGSGHRRAPSPTCRLPPQCAPSPNRLTGAESGKGDHPSLASSPYRQLRPPAHTISLPPSWSRVTIPELAPALGRGSCCWRAPRPLYSGNRH